MVHMVLLAYLVRFLHFVYLPSTWFVRATILLILVLKRLHNPCPSRQAAGSIKSFEASIPVQPCSFVFCERPQLRQTCHIAFQQYLCIQTCIPAYRVPFQLYIIPVCNMYVDAKIYIYMYISVQPLNTSADSLELFLVVPLAGIRTRGGLLLLLHPEILTFRLKGFKPKP